MTGRILMFPGQGSQSVGMGQKLFEQSKIGKEVFAEIDDALSTKLSAMMFEGPAEQLGISEYTQPALMAHSMAVIRIIQQEFSTPLDKIADGLLGHSLGEYTALTASGVLQLADCARILRLRGQLMQQAVPQNIGAMAAIIGLSADKIEALTAQATLSPDDFCTLANDNSAAQGVISGHASAVQRAMELCKEAGAKRALLLPVSVPSHCALMQPAADMMQDELQNISFAQGTLPVYANVSTQAANDADVMRADLVQQLCGRVRFRETIESLHQAGHEEFVEIGSGKVLTGLVKRIATGVQLLNLGTDMQEIEDFINRVK